MLYLFFGRFLPYFNKKQGFKTKKQFFQVQKNSRHKAGYLINLNCY